MGCTAPGAAPILPHLQHGGIWVQPIELGDLSSQDWGLKHRELFGAWDPGQTVWLLTELSEKSQTCSLNMGSGCWGAKSSLSVGNHPFFQKGSWWVLKMQPSVVRCSWAAETCQEEWCWIRETGALLLTCVISYISKEADGLEMNNAGFILGPWTPFYICLLFFRLDVRKEAMRWTLRLIKWPKRPETCVDR